MSFNKYKYKTGISKNLNTNNILWDQQPMESNKPFSNASSFNGINKSSTGVGNLCPQKRLVHIQQINHYPLHGIMISIIYILAMSHHKCYVESTTHTLVTSRTFISTYLFLFHKNNVLYINYTDLVKYIVQRCGCYKYILVLQK